MKESTTHIVADWGSLDTKAAPKGIPYMTESP